VTSPTSKALVILFLLCAPLWAANDFSGDPNCVALWDPNTYLTVELDSIGNNEWVVSPIVYTTAKKEGDACMKVRGDIGTYGLGLVGRMERPDADCSANTPGKNGTSNSTFSWCGWLYIDNLAAAGTTVEIGGKTGFTGGKNSWEIVQAHMIVDGNWKSVFALRIGYSNGGSWETIPHHTAVVAARWYYVAMTFNGSDRSYRIRIWDDTAGAILGVDATGTATNDMNIEDAQLFIGSMGAYPFRALIDDVLLFADVLTTDEIDSCRANNYDYAADSDCVSHWGLNTSEFPEDDVGTNDWTKSTSILLDRTYYKTGTEAMHLGLHDTYTGTYGTRIIPDASLDAGFPLKNGDTNKKISVCYWIRPATLTLNIWTVDVLIKSASGKTSWTTALNINTAKPLMSIGYSGGTAWEPKVAANPAVLAGRWYHVGVTYDDSDKSYRIRVWDENAATVYETTGNTTNNINVEDAKLQLVGPYGTFDGAIDELVVFNDVLTAKEIDCIRQGKYPKCGGRGQVIVIRND